MKLLASALLVSLARHVAAEDCLPRHVHLAGGADASTEVTISWSTTDPCASEQTLDLSPHSDLESYTTYSSSSDPITYTTTTSKYGSYTSPYLHSISISDLSPSTTYTYTIPSVDSMNPTSSFATAPSPNQPGAYPIKAALVGDLGQTSDSATTVKHIAEEGVDFIAHAGDMSYADCDQSRWDSWFDMVQYLSAETPWYVVAGNHEIERSDVDGSIFAAYEARFDMPAVSPAVTSPFMDDTSCTPSAFIGEYDFGNSFYTVTHGPVLLLMLNSYTDTSEDSAQYAWLSKTLEQVDRSVTPWVIALFHSPFYNSFSDHQNEKQQILMKSSMESLFVEHKVNACFSGHVHGYERSYNVAYEERDEAAPTYVIIGDGGNREGHASGFINNDPPAWSAVRDNTIFGHALMTFLNDTHAEFVWSKNVAEGVFEVADSVTLVNQAFMP